MRPHRARPGNPGPVRRLGRKPSRRGRTVQPGATDTNGGALSVRVRKNLIAVVGALSLGGATMAAVAIAGEPLPAEPAPPESKLVERPGQRFLSVIEAQA